VEVGQPIAVLGEPGEAVDDLTEVLTRLGVRVPDSPAVAAESSQPASATPASPAQPTAAVASQATATRIFASPLARRLAREAGIATAQIRGSGPGGRIVRRDVELAVSQRAAHAAVAAAEPPVLPTDPPRPATIAAAAAGPAAFIDRPHSLMRKAIAERLTASKQTIPHFYVRGTCRVDRLLEVRNEINAGGSAKVSLNDLVVKAAAVAHTRVPALNVAWTPTAIRSFAGVDIGVAIGVDGGLVTPVLRSVEQMSVATLSNQVRDFADRAKRGRLRPEELEGGTLAITNLGMFGVEEFAAIINPPHAAILAVGAVRKEPIVSDDAVKIGATMRVTLSVDHRAVDGVLAAEWLATYVSIVENPLQIFL
jgi:pyruvate dehydrogenase E2 component (dihydrolipoamide acetyltransferase)